MTPKPEFNPNQEIRNLISSGKTSDAIDKILEITPDNKEVLLIKARFNKYRRKYNHEYITTEHYDVVLNNINKLLLDYHIPSSYSHSDESKRESQKTEESEKATSVSKPIIPTKKKPIILLSIFILVFSTIVLAIFYERSNRNNPLNLPIKIEYIEVMDSSIITGTVDINYKNGKAEYIIYFVNGSSWSLGKTVLTPEQLNLLRNNRGLVDRLNAEEIKEIVCFGNASYEEDVTKRSSERRKIEEERARKRSLLLTSEISKNVSKTNIPIYALNLGQCMIENQEESVDQRGLIAIGIKELKGVSLEKALYDGLTEIKHQQGLRINILNYSLVDSTDRKLALRKIYN